MKKNDIESLLSILPEEEVPVFAVNCCKCELSKQRSRIIWAEGYPDAPVLVLLDNPGAREDSSGSAFLCGTRQTLQSLAIQSGVSLNNLYITYVVKCRPRKAYNKQDARSKCLEYFRWQTAQCSPKIIFCLGNVAVQALFEDSTYEVKNLRGRWLNWHKFPVCVSYHPLAVRRRPNLFLHALNDWERVASEIQGDGSVVSN